MLDERCSTRRLPDVADERPRRPRRGPADRRPALNFTGPTQADLLRLNTAIAAERPGRHGQPPRRARRRVARLPERPAARGRRDRHRAARTRVRLRRHPRESLSGSATCRRTTSSATASTPTRSRSRPRSRTWRRRTRATTTGTTVSAVGSDAPKATPGRRRRRRFSPPLVALLGGVLREARAGRREPRPAAAPRGVARVVRSPASPRRHGRARSRGFEADASRETRRTDARSACSGSPTSSGPARPADASYLASRSACSGARFGSTATTRSHSRARRRSPRAVTSSASRSALGRRVVALAPRHGTRATACSATRCSSSAATTRRSRPSTGWSR